MIFSHGWGQSWLGPCPLFTPRLSEFGLIPAIHSISTHPVSLHMYNECFYKPEIWIHSPQPSPHTGFWVAGVDNFGSSTLRFTPRRSVFRLIQEFHCISTLPTSPYKYDEWLKKAEIGICALKWSQKGRIQSRMGTKLAWPLSTSHTKIEWAWTISGNSQHPNPSSLSPYV